LAGPTSKRPKGYSAAKSGLPAGEKRRQDKIRVCRKTVMRFIIFAPFWIHFCFVAILKSGQDVIDQTLNSDLSDLKHKQYWLEIHGKTAPAKA
jgi:hypothetical protein